MAETHDVKKGEKKEEHAHKAEAPIKEESARKAWEPARKETGSRQSEHHVRTAPKAPTPEYAHKAKELAEEIEKEIDKAKPAAAPAPAPVKKDEARPAEKKEGKPAEKKSGEKREDRPADKKLQGKKEEAPVEKKSDGKKEEIPVEKRSEGQKEEVLAEEKAEGKKEGVPEEKEEDEGKEEGEGVEIVEDEGEKKEKEAKLKKKGKKKKARKLHPKPELAPGVARAMALRKELKGKTPHFVRQESYNYIRVGDSWRRPKGTHSKLRHHIKYRINVVSIGYGGPKAARGLHPSGFREVLVHHPRELDDVNPKTQAARIAHGVGTRKREMIERRAERMGIRVLNEMA